MATNNTKQATWVAIGSFFSFIVGILIPMILSRYFTKADYGTYKQVLFIYSTLLTIFSLGLPRAYAYFLPQVKETQAKDLIWKLTKIFLLLGFIFSLLLIIFSGYIADLMNNPNLKLALLYFSPYPFLMLPTQGIEGIFATYKKTKFLALFTVLSRLATVFFAVIPVVILKGTYLDSIIGMVVAGFFTFLVALYLRNIPLKNVKTEKSGVGYCDIFQFAMPLLYQSIFGFFLSSSSQYYISHFFGTIEFAEFSNGFISLPFVGMIVGAVATVLLPTFSSMHSNYEQKEKMLQLWQSSLKKSSQILFPFLIYSIFFSELVMTCMYGDMYSGSSKYFILKTINSFFCVIPFAPIILAIGQQKKYALAHLLDAIMLLSLQGVAVFYNCSPLTLIVIFVVCDVITQYLLLLIITNYYKVMASQLVPIPFLLKLLSVSSLSAFITLMFLNLFNCNKFLNLFLSLLLFFVIYYIMCFVFKITYKQIVESFVNNNRIGFIVKLIP